MLYASGIRYIVFDKDNTLTVPYSHHYFSDLLMKSVLVDAANSLNGVQNIALLSNSVGSSDDKDYSEAI